MTITDFASCYLLTCEALLTTQERFAFRVSEVNRAITPRFAFGVNVRPMLRVMGVWVDQSGCWIEV